MEKKFHKKFWKIKKKTKNFNFPKFCTNLNEKIIFLENREIENFLSFFIYLFSFPDEGYKLKTQVHLAIKEYSNRNSIRKLIFEKIISRKHLILKNHLVLFSICLNLFECVCIIFQNNFKILFFFFFVKKKSQLESIKTNFKISIKAKKLISFLYNGSKISQVLFSVLQNSLKSKNCFDFFFLIKIKIWVNNKNQKKTFRKKEYFSFLLINFEKTIGTVSVSFGKELFAQINLFNKKKFERLFLLVKNENQMMYKVDFGFFFTPNRSKCHGGNLCFYFYVKNYPNFFDFMKKTETDCLDFFLPKRWSFYFLCFSKFLFQKKSPKTFADLESVFFCNYLFKIKKIFFVWYYLYFYHHLKITRMSVILNKTNLKEKSGNFFFYILDFVLGKKNKSSTHLDFFYVNFKKFMLLVSGDQVFFSLIENRYVSSRFFILLDYFSKKITKIRFKKRMSAFFLQHKLKQKICPVYNFFKNTKYFFYKKIFTNLGHCIKTNSLKHTHQFYAIGFVVEVNFLPNDFLKNFQIRRILLPLKVFKVFKSHVCICVLQNKKTLLWNFNFVEFLFKIEGILCRKLRLFFFYVFFQQMLIFLCFNKNPIIFERDLNFLISCGYLGNSLLKKNFKKKLPKLTCFKIIKKIKFLTYKKFFVSDKLVNFFYNNLFFYFFKKKLISKLHTHKNEGGVHFFKSFLIKFLKTIFKLKFNELVFLLKTKISSDLFFDSREIKFRAKNLIENEYIGILSNRYKYIHFYFYKF